MSRNNFSIRPSSVLKEARYEDENTQTAMLQAGLMCGRITQNAVAENNKLPKDLWENLYTQMGNRRNTIRIKLVGQKLNAEQRRHVIETEKNSQVLETFLQHNTCTVKQAEKLLELNKPRVTVTLGLKALHRKLGREKMRKALYLCDTETQSALVLGALNLEERNEKKQTDWAELESMQTHNMQETFKLVRNLLKHVNNLKDENCVALLLSSNKEYAKHLDLLEAETLTPEEQNKLGLVLAHSVIQNETLTYLKTLCENLKAQNQHAILNVLWKNYTCTEENLANISKTTYKVNNVDPRPKIATKGENLYAEQNLEEIEKHQKLYIENLKTYNKASISPMLLLRSSKSVEENRTWDRTQRRNYTWESTAVDHLLYNYNIGFGWGKLRKPYSHIYYRRTKPELERKERINKIVEKAGKTLKGNTTAWQYWFGIGWNNIEEAEQTLNLAVLLARSEKQTEQKV